MLCLFVCNSASANSDKAFYKKAQEHMDADLYQIYRISERLIRANKLYDFPWTIEIPSKDDYKIHASTTAGNLIVLNRSMPSTFLDDPSTLAHIIAHEMAHQEKKHVARMDKQIRFINNELVEKNALLQKHIEQHNRKAQKGSIFGFRLPALYGRNNVSKLNHEIDTLKEYIRQKELDLLALNRKQEYEADKVALVYMTRAGFDPQGSIKTMEFLQRLEAGDDNKMTHPSSKKRKWQLQTALKYTDVNALKGEGLYNIKKAKPLTYKTSKHYQYKFLVKKILVIYTPSKSSDANKPFEDMFGY